MRKYKMIPFKLYQSLPCDNNKRIKASQDYKLLPYLKRKADSWRGGTEAKSMSCICSSIPGTYTVVLNHLWDPHPLLTFMGTRHTCGIYTDMQTKVHIFLKIFKKKIRKADQHHQIIREM